MPTPPQHLVRATRVSRAAEDLPVFLRRVLVLAEKIDGTDHLRPGTAAEGRVALRALAARMRASAIDDGPPAPECRALN